MYSFRKILHPTDFSDESAAAFRLACSLAKQLDAEVIVLHVVPNIAWGEDLATPSEEGAEEQLWQEYLLPIQSTEPGIVLSRRMEEGLPEEVIVRVAADLGCDLIVLGTHGRQGLSRLLMGSVAEHVMCNAPCPVMTIRGMLTEKVSSVADVQEATREGLSTAEVPVPAVVV